MSTGKDLFSKQNKKYDERDTMFSRMARKRGTPAYEDYYSCRKEYREKDDHLRQLPRLLEPGGKYYHPQITTEARRIFDAIEKISMDKQVIDSWASRFKKTDNHKRLIHNLCRSLGAIRVGFAELDQAFVYSHKGRFDEVYGRVIELNHPTVIVFLVEMDFYAMQQAPRAQVIRESAHQYYRAAKIALTVEALLQSLGYAAKAQYDAHYDLVLPPLAVAAGLGEVGRNNILISDGYGSRVRIGAISTDLIVEYDHPVSLGVDHFCQICKKCAETCPSRALDAEEKKMVNGELKWPTNVERCYAYWRGIGTDCGICMAVCPFSHKYNWFHNLVREIVYRFSWTHSLVLYLDNLIYRHKFRQNR